MKTNDKLDFYGDKGASLIPFLIFLVITIALSMINLADINMMCAAGVVGLIIGMFFAKDKGKYWNTVLEGLGDKVGMTAVLIWLVVGIYGNILRAGQLSDGLVWLADKLSLSGAAFCVAAFLLSAGFAIATGAAFGTIAAMTPVLYPVGIILGSNPACLAGAIVSGGLFGDNIAPVSDTSICAASGQTYTNKDGIAEIGGCVRERAKIVIPTFIITVVLYAIFGGAGGASGVDQAVIQDLVANHQNPAGLLMLVPTVIVIGLAIKGKSLFEVLPIGIIVSTVLGLVAGLFEFSDLISIQDGAVTGAVPSGVSGMFNVCILLMVIVSMSYLVISSGMMEAAVDKLSETANTTTKAQLVIFFFVSIMNVLIAAINTIPNICCGTVVNEIGKKAKLHPYLRANLIAIPCCSFHFLPFSGSVLFILGFIKTMAMDASYIVVPTAASFLTATFYPVVLWTLTLIAILTGFMKMFEGPDGKPVKEEPKD